MRASVLAVGVLASLLLAPARAQERPAPAVPADRLPVLGTVGDLPPEAERVIVEADAKGGISVLGEKAEISSLREYLLPRAGASREETGATASKLHVVLRVDRDLPWQSTQWLLQACADPGLRIYRILFAAKPEDGGPEGAMATYLPVDLGIAPARGERLRLPIRLGADPEENGVTGDVVYACLRERFRGHLPSAVDATIDADPRVSTGAVLGAVDALLRWGAEGITFRGTTTQQRKTGPGGDSPDARPGVVLADRPARSTVAEDEMPPPVARVTGRLAGQVVAPAAPATEPFEGIAHSSVSLDSGTAGMFGGRRGGHRSLVPEGGAGTQSATESGLEWLRRHQSANGHWSGEGFESLCGGNRCGGAGVPGHDVGVTGLALLAYLGYGETHKTPRFGATVRGALKWLKGTQDAEGCYGPRTDPRFTKDHALGALAMCEAYGLTQSPLFKANAQNGVNFILQCRNPGEAWGPGVRSGENDVEITSWMILALKSAKSAGLDVDAAALSGARAWLDAQTDPATGRTGEDGKGAPARTAQALLARILSGADREDDLVCRAGDLLVASPPAWDEAAGSVDFVGWYFGTLALFQLGGDRWAAWNRSMKAALIDHQVQDRADDRWGSWDPVDPATAGGGRVYVTAMNTLTLEVYYRYARVFGTK